jgi:large subunit ribosomal protein L32e
MAVTKKWKPRFHRQGIQVKKRARNVWRRPRGKDSKQRRNAASRGARPRVGYIQPAGVRYLHPSGLSEVLVFTPGELAGLKADKAVRIAAGLGVKKRAEIVRLAGEMKLKVLNPGTLVEIKSGKKPAAAAAKTEKK